MIRTRGWAATDVGRIRDGNEDSFVCIDGLYFVADGMGGHSAGEVASDIAVRTLEHIYGASPEGLNHPDIVEAAVEMANMAIFSESMADSTKTGMGTTLTGLVVSDAAAHRVIVANVGDSRTYLWRHGELRQVTKDHSHVQNLVDRGAITRAEARVHYQRNIVLRAMGIEPTVEVDTFELDVEVGDRFVVCSDGLVDEADDTEIENEIRAAADGAECAERLVALANRNGGRDNITVVVVDVEFADEDIAPSIEATSLAGSVGTDAVAIGATETSAPTGVGSSTPTIWFSVAAWSLWLAATSIVVGVVIAALSA
jgi:protein phosphatase